jgi:hypothetical protein
MHGYSLGRDAAVVISSREPSGRNDPLSPARERAVNEQDALPATGASNVCVRCVRHRVRHGTPSPDDEGDHELVGSQHVGHALYFLVRSALLRPAGVSASTKKSDPELA